MKALRSGDIALSSIVEEGTSLFLRCYGYPKLKTMTEARIRSWKNRVAVNNIAPNLEPLYGWHFDTSSSCLQPAFGPPDLILVPDNLLKIMRCGCKSGEPCKGSRCSCYKAKLPCTTFCDCEGGITCHNPFKQASNNDNDGEAPQ